MPMISNETINEEKTIINQSPVKKSLPNHFRRSPIMNQLESVIGHQILVSNVNKNQLKKTSVDMLSTLNKDFM